ncbi:rhodanese-like domain-containing protein [Komarekiella sp. 'clone 1']|uniref:Rhodanese-like domain-containing protein n=1 Tax=Komarekiella delphini-convector SJRDD-AB1 TaxID=2593771 RepID=A0AA40VST1_9NOST|nr:rhodanese-like domain-containing protein [Komarekiella delphini-convector SJRDD-AB1]
MDNLVGGIIPPQPPIDAQSDVHTLKSRLEWGEPAFTILDVRDRMTYNQGHIMGSMPMPIDQLEERAVASLDKSRDIYVYGANDEQTTQAAQILRSAQFVHVSELKGGLAAWKAIGGPTEGIVESRTPAGEDDYNVVARMQNHLENQPKGGASATESIQKGASNLKENIQEGASNLKEGIQEGAGNLKEGIQKGINDIKEDINESGNRS